MKKIVSLGAAASIAALSVVSASAAMSAVPVSVKSDKTEVKTGDEVVVTVVASSISADAVGISFDVAASGLELKSATVSSKFMALDNSAKPTVLVFTNAGETYGADEVVATLTYTVTAAAGEAASVTISANANDGGMTDIKTDKVSFTVADKAVDPEKADLTKLTKAINDGEAKIADKDKYESVADLEKAVADANKLTAESKQADVDAAEKAITDAIAALKEKGGAPEKTDLEKAKEDLAAAQEAASKLDKTKYTEESYKAVTNAVAAAEKLGADADAAAVAAAATAINDAIGALKPPVPDTGVALAIVPVALAAAGVVVAKKKRS